MISIMSETRKEQGCEKTLRTKIKKVPDIKKVLDIINDHPKGISRVDLLQELKIDEYDLTRIINCLINENKVRKLHKPMKEGKEKITRIFYCPAGSAECEETND